MNKKNKIKKNNLKFNDFFLIHFVKNIFNLIILLFLSLITSSAFYYFQNQDIEIIKSLRPSNEISTTNILFDRISIKKNSVLTEYIEIIRLGITEAEFENTIKKADNIQIDFTQFENFRSKTKIEKTRDDDKSVYKIIFRDKLSFKKNILFDKNKNIYKIASNNNEKFTRKIKFLDEVIKYRILEYIDGLRSFQDEDQDNQNMVYKFDKTEISISTNSKKNIPEFFVNGLKENYGFKKKSFVEGMETFNYKIIKYSFFDCLLIFTLCYLIIFSLIIMNKSR